MTDIELRTSISEILGRAHYDEHRGPGDPRGRDVLNELVELFALSDAERALQRKNCLHADM